MKRKYYLIFLLFLQLYAQDVSDTTFATWEVFEADKLASIWLIKKFIAPFGKVMIYKRDTTIQDTIAFDTPQALFKRTFNKCTFEMLMDYYAIKDKKIHAIALLIHDIEINKWDRKRFERTKSVDQTIITFIKNIKDTNQLIEKACHYFDQLYENIPLELKQMDSK